MHGSYAQNEKDVIERGYRMFPKKKQKKTRKIEFEIGSNSGHPFKVEWPVVLFPSSSSFFFCRVRVCVCVCVCVCECVKVYRCGCGRCGRGHSTSAALLRFLNHFELALSLSLSLSLSKEPTSLGNPKKKKLQQINSVQRGAQPIAYHRVPGTREDKGPTSTQK